MLYIIDLYVALSGLTSMLFMLMSGYFSSRVFFQFIPVFILVLVSHFSNLFLSCALVSALYYSVFNFPYLGGTCIVVPVS